MPELPSRVVVLGLARSGRAAVEALRAWDVEVVADDANEELDTEGIDAEIHLGVWHDEQ